ncbi:purine-nucleoside phosphorylase [bacterium]|nr:purine-nucleoside phosphorylase [bacterium]
MKTKIKQAADFILSKISKKPTVALVLGSGLGKFADGLKNATAISYSDIPHFPVATVEGHAGKLVIGEAGGKVVVAMQGRFHFYEGHPMHAVTFPMRVMQAIGAVDLIITNAAGGLNPAFKVGSLMLMSDHINFMGTNPLIGPNDSDLGVRFPPIQGIYNKDLINEALKIGKEMGAPIETGVYIAVTGPSYETAAELRAFRKMGADAVGMSTVPEVIVAAHCGIKRVLGISCITNMATGESETAANHEEVITAAADAQAYFLKLVETMIERF